jgi:branched-chain amino acid transport system permease protein
MVVGRNAAHLLIFALIVALSAAPLLVEEFIVHLLFILLIYATLAQAFNILAGFAGYLSLGHVVYYGIGMYVTAVMLKASRVPLAIACFLGATFAAIFGLATSIPLFKLRGASFALGTLAVATFMHTLFSQEWLGLGGSTGMILRAPLSFSRLPFYYAALMLVLLISSVAKYIRQSRFGLALLAIREDEDAAEVLGIKTLKEKLKAVGVSAFFTGLCGGIMASYTRYVCPDNAFPLLISLQMQFMPILGGLGTVVGPIIGAVALIAIDSFFTFTVKGLSVFFYALMIVLIMIFMPEGIWGTWLVRRRRVLLRNIGTLKDNGGSGNER